MPVGKSTARGITPGTRHNGGTSSGEGDGGGGGGRVGGGGGGGVSAALRAARRVVTVFQWCAMRCASTVCRSINTVEDSTCDLTHTATVP